MYGKAFPPPGAPGRKELQGWPSGTELALWGRVPRPAPPGPLSSSSGALQRLQALTPWVRARARIARFPKEEKIRVVLGLTCPPAPSEGSLFDSEAPLRGWFRLCWPLHLATGMIRWVDLGGTFLPDSGETCRRQDAPARRMGREEVGRVPPWA